MGARGGEALLKSLTKARAEYRIERWWWYGKPGILDILKGSLNVSDLAQVSKITDTLIQQHGRGFQVTFDVFPYGIKAPDGVRINFMLEKEVR